MAHDTRMRTAVIVADEITAYAITNRLAGAAGDLIARKTRRLVLPDISVDVRSSKRIRLYTTV